MITDTAIENVSPLMYKDTTHICRVARTAIVALCAGCGETVYHGLHLPLIAHGLFCGRCCPCSTFVPTPEEVAAIERNRALCDAETREAVREFRRAKAKPVKPIESPEERRARFRLTMADVMKHRWQDPADKAAMLASMKGRKPTVQQKPVPQQKATVGRKRTVAPCLLAAGLTACWNGPWK